jgi:hypothetical protein
MPLQGSLSIEQMCRLVGVSRRLAHVYSSLCFSAAKPLKTLEGLSLLENLK